MYENRAKVSVENYNTLDGMNKRLRADKHQYNIICEMYKRKDE
jgi:hypothetical protein